MIHNYNGPVGLQNVLKNKKLEEETFDMLNVAPLFTFYEPMKT